MALTYQRWVLRTGMNSHLFTHIENAFPRIIHNIWLVFSFGCRLGAVCPRLIVGQGGRGEKRTRERIWDSGLKARVTPYWKVRSPFSILMAELDGQRGLTPPLPSSLCTSNFVHSFNHFRFLFGGESWSGALLAAWWGRRGPGASSPGGPARAAGHHLIERPRRSPEGATGFPKERVPSSPNYMNSKLSSYAALGCVRFSWLNLLS